MSESEAIGLPDRRARNPRDQVFLLVELIDRCANDSDLCLPSRPSLKLGLLGP